MKRDPSKKYYFRKREIFENVKFSKLLDSEISVRCSPTNDGYFSDRAPER